MSDCVRKRSFRYSAQFPQTSPSTSVAVGHEESSGNEKGSRRHEAAAKKAPAANDVIPASKKAVDRKAVAPAAKKVAVKKAPAKKSVAKTVVAAPDVVAAPEAGYVQQA